MHFDAKPVTLLELTELAAQGNLRGFFRVTNHDYHLGPGLSSTSCKELLRSPAHFKAKTNEQTPAMARGSAVHCAVLEPDEFAKLYAVEPHDIGDKTRNPGKKLWDEFKARAYEDCKEVLRRDDFDVCLGVSEAIGRHPEASQLLMESQCEVAAYWTDEETGVLLKCKADMALPWALADLKTCTDARPESFARSVRNLRYHLSAAMYLDGFNALGASCESFIWMAVETSAPFGLMLLPATQAMIEQGRHEYKTAVKLFQSCTNSNSWPCYQTGFVELDEFDHFFRRKDA